MCDISLYRGNASKTRASLPQATVEQNRRELVTICQECWQFTNFRHNKGEIGILPLMVRLLIHTYRTAEHQPGRLRGELTSQEIKKHVTMCFNGNQAKAQVRTDAPMRIKPVVHPLEVQMDSIFGLGYFCAP